MTSLRERSHVILWLLLFFFIASMTVGGLVGGSNILGVIFGSKDTRNYVGNIDGKRISIREYDYQLRVTLNNILSSSGANSLVSEQTLHRQTWDALKEDYIIKEKIKELNLTVYADEVREYMLQSPPETYKASLTSAGFFSDSTGNFDLISYQNSIKNGTMPLATKQLNIRWEDGLKNWLANKKLRDAYNLLVSVSDNEIKDEYMRNNINLSVDYLYINPNNIDDSLLIISDDELSNYYSDNKEKYETDEKVSINYVLYEPKTAPEDTLNYNIEKDSLMNEAFILSDESSFTSFNDAILAYDKTITDTIVVSQSLEGFSGVPTSMGSTRKVIRFAFDNDINFASAPIEMKNGIAVFNIIKKEDKTFKTLEEVKETITRTLLKNAKDERAKLIISGSRNSKWSESSASNELLNLELNHENKISGNYKGVGKSPELEGVLSYLSSSGEISKIIKTPTAYVYVKLISKSEFDDNDYNEQYSAIKSQLLISKQFSGGYNGWLQSRKEEIEIEDWRHLIY